jgi:diguanylate cyclase (GGDEF)-like protein
VVARNSGEEFALVLPATNACGVRSVAERLRAAVASRPWPLRPVTASFGLATTITSDPEAIRLIEEADRALYVSKPRSRDRVTHHLDLVPSPLQTEMGFDEQRNRW